MHAIVQPLSSASIHEASHIVLGAYVGAADIYVVLHFGKPRCNFTHFLAMPGLVMSYAGYAGDRLLSKLSESDCAVRSISDGGIREMILNKMANHALEASRSAEAKYRAFELVQRFRNEIGETAAVIQRYLLQRRSIPAEIIEQMECVVRLRAMGKAEGETDARREAE